MFVNTVSFGLGLRENKRKEIKGNKYKQFFATKTSKVNKYKQFYKKKNKVGSREWGMYVLF